MYVYFWSHPGVRLVYEFEGTLSDCIAYMRSLGGDRSKWCILGRSNQGLFNVPVLLEWF